MSEPSSANTLHLDQLDNTNLLCIFDYLEFTDLLNIAGLRGRFRSLIGHHFMVPKFRIHDQLIRFSDRRNLLDDNQFTLNRFGQILQLLQNYGDVITKLQFTRGSFTEQELTEISHYIERFCSSTLIELKLSNVGDFLLHMTKETFPKLAKLRFWSNYGYSNELQLARIYPNMEYLGLKIVLTTKLPIINHFSRNFRHLHVNDAGKNDSFLEGLISLNPQLRSLSLNRIPPIILTAFVSRNLPQLEALDVLYAPYEILNAYGNQSTHFKNVKKFKLSMKTDFRLVHFPFTFDALEELEIALTSYHTIPIQLIEQNNQLHALKIPLLFARNRHEIIEVISRFEKLEEITINWAHEIRRETIYLLGALNKLKRITFILMSNEKFCDLEGLMTNQWHLIHKHNESSIFTHFAFERDLVKRRL